MAKHHPLSHSRASDALHPVYATIPSRLDIAGQGRGNGGMSDSADAIEGRAMIPDIYQGDDGAAEKSHWHQYFIQSFPIVSKIIKTLRLELPFLVFVSHNLFLDLFIPMFCFY
jgi:hypothetical protein